MQSPRQRAATDTTREGGEGGQRRVPERSRYRPAPTRTDTDTAVNRQQHCSIRENTHTHTETRANAAKGWTPTQTQRDSMRRAQTDKSGGNRRNHRTETLTSCLPSNRDRERDDLSRTSSLVTGRRPAGDIHRQTPKCPNLHRHTERHQKVHHKGCSSRTANTIPKHNNKRPPKQAGKWERRRKMPNSRPRSSEEHLRHLHAEGRIYGWDVTGLETKRGPRHGTQGERRSG